MSLPTPSNTTSSTWNQTVAFALLRGSGFFSARSNPPPICDSEPQWDQTHHQESPHLSSPLSEALGDDQRELDTNNWCMKYVRVHSFRHLLLCVQCSKAQTLQYWRGSRSHIRQRVYTNWEMLSCFRINLFCWEVLTWKHCKKMGEELNKAGWLTQWIKH